MRAASDHPNQWVSSLYHQGGIKDLAKGRPSRVFCAIKSSSTRILTVKKRPSALDQYLAGARSALVRLDPADAYAATQRGALLVDIRPEFQRRRDGEVPSAIIVERNHLEWRLHPDSPARIPEATRADVQWIVLCDEGYASSLAAAVLQALGLRRATDVIGGLRAWRAAGMPIGAPGQVSAPRLAPEAD